MKNKYSDIMFSFDIETTKETIIDDLTGDTVPVSVMYLSSLLGIDFSDYQSINILNYENYLLPTMFFRTDEEVIQELNYLNEKAEKEGKTYIVWCHNLAYEYEYLKNNVDDLIDAVFRTEEHHYIFDAIQSPISFTYKHLEFRDSLRLSGKNLASLGASIGLKKLAGEKGGYDQKYYSFSKLPQIEYDYNERDNQIVLVWLALECQKYSWIKGVSDIPFTNTGFIRKNTRNLFKKEWDQYRSFCKCENPDTVEEYYFLEKLFSGGYTHSSIYSTGKVFENVDSDDASSMYPSQMYYRMYPKQFKHVIDDINERGHLIINDNLEHLKQNKMSSVFVGCLSHMKKPNKWGFMMKIRFHNIEVKKRNNTIMPILAFSKTDESETLTAKEYLEMLENGTCIIENGKIFKALEITTYITDIDFINLYLTYSWEDYTVLDLDITDQFDYLYSYVRSSVKYYSDRKTILKPIQSKLEERKPVAAETFKDVLSKEEVDYIQSLSVETGEAYDYVFKIYMQSKAHLNGLYGVQVEKLLRDTLIINDEDEFEMVQNEEMEGLENRCFRDGIYITSYSRNALVMYSLYNLIFSNGKIDIIYWDTDSCKMVGDVSLIRKLTAQYNNIMKKQFLCKNGMMTFDFDGHYDYFLTLGSKKYISYHDNRFVLTVAGVPKKAGSKVFDDLLEKYYDSPEEVLKDNFHANVLFDASSIHKTGAKYLKENHVVKDVVDENGDSGHINTHSGMVITDVDYMLLSTGSRSNKRYIDLVHSISDTDIDTSKVVLYYENGEVFRKEVDSFNRYYLEKREKTEVLSRVKGGKE